jgi:hypothetical protein
MTRLVEAARRAQARQKHELAAALSGHPSPVPSPEPVRSPAGSFDGGARQSLPPPPPTHDQWLGELLRTRRADVGAHF